MNYERHSHPFNPISPNILGTKRPNRKHPAYDNGFDAMNDGTPQNGADGASDSPYDGLEENDTEDSFGKHMIREMRESLEERPRAFRKARPRARLGLTLENLERIPISKDGTPPPYVHRQAGSVSSSGGSRTSDPPLNVPKMWGTKARKNHDWLKRIKPDVDALEEMPKVGTSDPVDLSVLAADVPLPSVEETPLSHKSSRRETPVAEGVKKNTSLEEIKQLELDEDFSAQSLITSTPAPKTRNTALDEIRQLELENAVSDAMEETIYPTPPPEESRRRSSSPKNAHIRSHTPSHGQEGDLANSWSHPAEQEIDVTKGAKRKQSLTNLTKKLTNDSGPVSPGKSTHTVGDVDRDIQPDVQTNVQRPTHHREDSQDILRRLARASSGTPSPARVLSNAVKALSPKKSRQARFQDQRNDKKPVDSALDGGLTKDERVTTDVDAASKRLDLAIDHNLPNDLGGQSQSQSNLSQRISLDVQTPFRSPSKPLEPKTPRVTGAWIDTPKTTTIRRLNSNSSVPSPPTSDSVPTKTKPNTDPEHPSTAPTESNANPKLPSSALAAVLASPENNGLGDSTITSLEDILGSSLLHPDDSTLHDLDLLTTNPPRNASEALRIKELKTLHDMNARLRAARSSIRDAKHGLSRVEQRISSQNGDGQEARAECKHCLQQQQQPHVPPTKLDFESADKPLLALSFAVKGIVWYSGASGRRRLTWLALLILLVWAYFWVEVVACMVFCRPVYAYPGTGINPHAPEFPFVIPTLLLKPFGWIWKPIVLLLGSIVVPVVRWLWRLAWFLWEDQRLREEWRRAATKTVGRVVRTVAEEWVGMPTGGNSMADDELL
jgi:hypothetical protein